MGKTVVEPEIVLIFVFVITLLLLKMRHNQYLLARSGRIAMAAMLVVTAIEHFMFTKGMTMVIPDYLPNKTVWVYVTGALEIAAAIGLCIPRLYKVTGLFLITFFILLIPANIYEAIKHVDIENASFDGPDVHYLWYRVPLQIIFIVWVYLSTQKSPLSHSRNSRVYHYLV